MTVASMVHMFPSELQLNVLMYIYVCVPIASIVASPAGRVRGERIASCTMQRPMAGRRDDCSARWTGAAGEARWTGGACSAKHRGPKLRSSARASGSGGGEGPAAVEAPAAHHTTGRRTKYIMMIMLHNMMRSCSFIDHANVCVYLQEGAAAPLYMCMSVNML